MLSLTTAELDTKLSLYDDSLGVVLSLTTAEQEWLKMLKSLSLGVVLSLTTAELNLNGFINASGFGSSAIFNYCWTIW